MPHCKFLNACFLAAAIGLLASQASAIEDRDNDDQRHSEFSLTIDGNDGSVVGYPESYENLHGLWVTPLE